MLGMEDVADLPRKKVSYAEKAMATSGCADQTYKPSVLGKLKAAQKRIAGEQKERQKQEKKQEQQL